MNDVDIWDYLTLIGAVLLIVTAFMAWQWLGLACAAGFSLLGVGLFGAYSMSRK